MQAEAGEQARVVRTAAAEVEALQMEVVVVLVRMAVLEALEQPLVEPFVMVEQLEQVVHIVAAEEPLEVEQQVVHIAVLEPLEEP